MTEKPGPPEKLTTAKVGPDFVTLDWTPPTKTGGEKVKGYIVKMKEGPSDEWTTVATVKPFDNSYKVANLKDGVEYTFAVSAENSVGQGDMCQLDSTVVPKKPAGMLVLFVFELFVLYVKVINR